MSRSPWRMYRFMREHRFARPRLSEYVDGELLADDELRVHRHIELCSQCRRVLEELRLTLAALARLRERDPGRSVADAVIARLRAEG